MPLPERAPDAAPETEPQTAEPAAKPDGPASAQTTPAATAATPPAEPAAPPQQALAKSDDTAPAPPTPFGIPATTVPLPPKPDGLLAERAKAVLEKHCARCHQANALKNRAVSSGAIADILDLDRIAHDPSLVRRGEPDASPLYQQMIARQMPSDVLRHGAPGPEPDAAEVRAIRAWIAGLEPRTASAQCADRQPITAQSLAASAEQWLAATGPERAADTRFISLAHLYNACLGDAELTAHRLAVAQILASLTWSNSPVSVDTVGDTLALLAVRLGSLGWTGQHWQELAARLPASARMEFPEALRRQTGTDVPVVNADWLAHAVMQPELYARLLGLPATLDDLARILGIDLDDKREGRTVRRGVTTSSSITSGPRVIERYKTASGALWLAHDYAPPTTGSVLDYPLLPWAAASGNDESEHLPKLTGTRAIFTLPSGLPAFMLFDENGAARPSLTLAAEPGDGARAAADPPPSDEDKADKEKTQKDKLAATKEKQPTDATKPNGKGTEKDKDDTKPSPARADRKPQATQLHTIVSGLSCAACHATGPASFEDALAEHLDSQAYRGNTIARDIARQITVGKAELEALLSDDRFTVRNGLGALSIDAATRIAGHDLITGLARRHDRDLDMIAAAAELLAPPGDVGMRLSRLSRTIGPHATLATRLALGRLTRPEFELLRPALVGTLDATGAVAALAPLKLAASDAKPLPPPPPGPGTLQLWPDRISYARDERVVLHVRTGHTCHLTLVNVDHAGKATVLFPNEFARDNLVKAGETRRLPAVDALYYFRLQHPGSETFVAICEEGEPVPAGVRPDLTHLNFTELGDWQDFLDTSMKAARESRVPLSNGDDIDRRRRDARPKLRPPPDRSPAQARAAITISIAP